MRHVTSSSASIRWGRWTAAAAGLLVAALSGASYSGDYVPPPGDDQPQWLSSDRIAYRWHTGDGLGYEFRTVDLADRAVTRFPNLRTQKFAFSPDLSRIAYTTFEDGGYRLVISGLDGAGRVTVPSDHHSRVRWSPDASLVAFDRFDGIWLVRPDGSSLRRVLDDASAAAWSPDGTALAFVRTSTRAVEVARADGSDRHVISGTWLTRVVYGEPAPAWSSRGEIAFLFETEDNNRGVAITRPGSGVRTWAFGDVFLDFAWSPDGSVLAVGVTAYVARRGLFVLDPDTGAIRKVAPFGRQPAWSADGSTIAFFDGGACYDRPGIHVVDVSGRRLRRLTSDCTIRGTPGDDTLKGTGQADVIYALGGDDDVDASWWLDTVYGGEGNDDIDGGGGHVTAYGGPGDDVLIGHYASDVLVGGPGDDTLVSGPGADSLSGGAGADELRAEGWRSEQRGGPGDDRIVGTTERDVIFAGTGRDLVHARGGADVIYVADGSSDRVDCGTNRYRGNFEADIVFRDSDDLVVRCEVIVPPEKKATTIALWIDSWPQGYEGAHLRFTLRCDPPRGTLPNKASACERLKDLSTPFRTTPPDTPCANATGGPAAAHVFGTFRGEPVDTDFRRFGSCEIARWDRVSFLFG